MPGPQGEPNLMFVPAALSRRHARSLYGMSDPSKLALLTQLLRHDYGYIPSEFGGAIVAAERNHRRLRAAEHRSAHGRYRRPGGSRPLRDARVLVEHHVVVHPEVAAEDRVVLALALV
mgnify:CR=1 FL=1